MHALLNDRLDKVLCRTFKSLIFATLYEVSIFLESFINTKKVLSFIQSLINEKKVIKTLTAFPSFALKKWGGQAVGSKKVQFFWKKKKTL